MQSIKYSKIFKEIPEQEIDKIIHRIKKYFNYNKIIFLNNSISYEDLLQEIFITIFNTIQKYKYKKRKELYKLIHLATGWKLKDILKQSKRNLNLYAYRIEDFNNYYKEDNHNNNLLLELFTLLDKKEYDILYKRFIENKTFKEIGKELNLTKQRIYQIYLNALKKLKSYINE